MRDSCLRFSLLAVAGALNACSSPSPSLDAGMADSRVVDPVDAMADAMADAMPDGPSTATKWARAYGTANTDFLGPLVVGSDRSVAVISYDIGTTVVVTTVVKLDEHGNQLWTHSLTTALAIAIDGADDVYVSGEFLGSLDIDGHVVTAPTTDYAEFLTKLDGATGVAEWAVLLANHSLFQDQDLAVSADGSTIAVTGGVGDTVNLGGDDLVTHGYGDVVVAVFDGAGAHRWSRSFGDVASEYPHDIELTATGDVVVCGEYGLNPDFGGGPLTWYGNRDTFMASYAGADGAHLWSYGFGGPDNGDVLRDLAVDGDAVYAAGTFWGTSQFGGPSVTASGTADAILLRYDRATGAYVWQNTVGDTGDAFLMGVAVTGGQIVFGGGFNGSAQLGSTHLDSNGYFDLLYGHADPATGAFVSGSSAGGADSDVAWGFGARGNDVWLAGDYLGDAYPLFGSLLPAAQGLDGFVGRTQL